MLSDKALQFVLVVACCSPIPQSESEMEQTRPKPVPSDMGHDVPLQVLFHGKWRYAVVRELASGPARLSQLRRKIPDCSKKVLIDTLHGLEQIGWIQREEYATRLKRVEYTLTDEWAKRITQTLAMVRENESSESSI